MPSGSGGGVQVIFDQALTPQMFRTRYADVFKGDKQWQAMGSSARIKAARSAVEAAREEDGEQIDAAALLRTALRGLGGHR